MIGYSNNLDQPAELDLKPGSDLAGMEFSEVLIEVHDFTTQANIDWFLKQVLPRVVGYKKVTWQ